MLVSDLYSAKVLQEKQGVLGTGPGGRLILMSSKRSECLRLKNVKRQEKEIPQFWCKGIKRKWQ